MPHIDDLWTRKSDKSKTALYGKGLRWRVIYDDGGKRRSKSFRTQDQARAFLTSVDHKQRSGEYVPAENRKALIGDLLPAWEASLIRLKPSTQGQIRYAVRADIEPKWGDAQVGGVKRQDVQQWVHELHTSKGSAGTVETVYGYLRGFYSWCVTEGHVPASPCQNIILPRRVDREHVYLNPQQVRALLDSIHPHYRLLILTLVTTGLRFGEAAELRVRDLDLLRRRLTVARSITRGVVTAPKSHRRRTVPLTVGVAEELAAHIEGKGREALVFQTIRGARLESVNFKKYYFDPAVEKAGLPPMRTHDLRHTTASLVGSSGGSVRLLQRMLGHSSAAITLDRYSGVYSDDLDDVSARIGKLIDA